MATIDLNQAPERMPEGYVAVPVTEAMCAVPVVVAVVVRRAGPETAAQLVLLRQRPDAQVYLGALMDAAGAVLNWLELWVQDIDNVAQLLPTRREAMNNETLDQHWLAHWRFLESAPDSGVIHTGYETKHPPPVIIDSEQLQPVHLRGPDGQTIYCLCEDDQLLEKRQLPPYHRSLHRYLYIPQLDEASDFIPVDQEAPRNNATGSLVELLGNRAEPLRLNPGGGYLIARRLDVIGLEDYLEFLTAGATALRARESPVGSDLEILCSTPDSAACHGRLFREVEGRCGRFVETYFLKLGLLYDMLRTVARLTEAQQRPLLSLRPGSFRVRLGTHAGVLPYLWTAAAQLADPGDALRVAFGSLDTEVFVRYGGSQPSVFQPEAMATAQQGIGSLRLRRVADQSDRTIVEATLVTEDYLLAARNDLIWVRCGLGGRRVEFHGHVEIDVALANGECRFRTLPMKLEPQMRRDLEGALGVIIPQSMFEVIPRQSSPCDLYALGILAVRALLVNAGKGLPEAKDEVFSLARRVGPAAAGEPAKLVERIGKAFADERRFVESLGPQRLSNDGFTPDVAFSLLPKELWWETLALFLRWFPGKTSEAVCADFGDASSGSLHAIYGRPQRELSELIGKARSLLVVDWQANRELRQVIDSVMSKQGSA